MPEISAAAFVLALIAVGVLLEHVGGKDGVCDEFFTWLPLGTIGSMIVLLEWEFA
jgi:hypothetical protein